MRARLASALAAIALLAPAAATTPRAVATPVAPGFTSPNVEWLAQLPDTGGISGRFVTDKAGKAKWFYLTTVSGLSIYDVSNPELPVPQGRLPLPHFENEDVDGNEDVAIVSTSPGGQIFVIDVRNKLAPTLLTTLQADDYDAHTSSCLDGCARWFYATEGNYLKAVDLRAALAGDGNAIHRVNYDSYVGDVHDLDQDAAGIVWMTGRRGGAGYTMRPLTKGVSAAVRAKTRTASPTNPVNVTNMVQRGHNYGNDPDVNDFTMHNSQRPTGAVYTQTRGKPRLAKGGVLLTTEEDYASDLTGGCKGAGRFHTWDATGSVENGTPLRRLDTFELAEATLDPANGQKQVADALCGAHWFTVRDNVVAMGMYAAGTRFLDVSNPRDIRQVGYWIAPDQETWAAYWVPGSDGVVYTVDLERGVDILRFTKPKAGTTVMAPAPIRTGGAHLRFDVRPRSETDLGYACPVVVRRRG
ncbi:MAG TPA: hypothetical protein VFQ85_04950 [Mycobacteriales bacterium]|nr:hypothetical protein [Mycobacteriales bacterium]